MSLSLFRALRRVVVVSIVVAVLVAGAFTNRADAGTHASTFERAAHTIDAQASAHRGGETRGHYPSAPLTLHAEHGVDVLAFPPATKAERKPLSVVYLHGMHGRASNGCPWFRGGASELGWLVCPEAIEAQPCWPRGLCFGRGADFERAPC